MGGRATIFLMFSLLNRYTSYQVMVWGGDCRVLVLRFLFDLIFLRTVVELSRASFISVIGESATRHARVSNQCVGVFSCCLCMPGRRALSSLLPRVQGVTIMMCRGHGPNVKLKRPFLTGVFIRSIYNILE